MEETGWVAVVAAVAAAIPGILMALQQRRKDKTDATDKLVQTALTLVKGLKEDNDRLKEENKDLRATIKALQRADTKPLRKVRSKAKPRLHSGEPPATV